MKNSRLGHHGHFLLLRGGGWIRSKVLARNSQGPHYDWPVGVQQTPVLPVPALLCPWCSFGHAWRVLLHPLTTDPHSEKGRTKTGEAGLPRPPGHATLGASLRTKADALEPREHAWHSAWHSACFSDSCCGKRVL